MEYIFIEILILSSLCKVIIKFRTSQEFNLSEIERYVVALTLMFVYIHIDKDKGYITWDPDGSLKSSQNFLNLILKQEAVPSFKIITLGVYCFKMVMLCPWFTFVAYVTKMTIYICHGLPNVCRPLRLLDFLEAR